MSCQKNSQTENTFDLSKVQITPQTPQQYDDMTKKSNDYYSFIGVPSQQIISFLDEKRKQQFERKVKTFDSIPQSPQLSGHQVSMSGKNSSKSKLSKRRNNKKRASKIIEHPLKQEQDSKEEHKTQIDNEESSDALIFALL